MRRNGRNKQQSSSLYRKWMNEQACETTQKLLIRIVLKRFKVVPKDLAAEIHTVTDLEQLARGVDLAVDCTSLDEFRLRFNPTPAD